MACGAHGCSGGCSGKTGAGGRAVGCGGGSCPPFQMFDWLNDVDYLSQAVGFDILEVAFKGGRTSFFRQKDGLGVHTGDYVVVEADRGVDLGTVHLTGERVHTRLRAVGLDSRSEYPDVVRKATLQDLEKWEEVRELDTESFVIARKIIDEMELSMKLVDVEWQFDRRKVTFYYTADHRVDFRELVKRLAYRFRARVEMRQIGARDEAARLGGIGSCGRELCCSTWLKSFRPVSTNAAKAQNLPLNPVRLSGQCGRLKCCLNYELEQYMSALKRFPALDSKIRTGLGEGVVRKIDIFKDIIWIHHRTGEWENLPLDQVASPAESSIKSSRS